MMFRPAAWAGCELSRLTGGLGHRWWGGTRCYRCGIRRNDGRSIKRNAGVRSALRDIVRRTGL